MTLLWIYAYNIATPVGLACLLGLVLCLWSGLFGRYRNNAPEISSLIYMGLILVLVGSLFYAIPSPTYDQKIVYQDRVVTRKVPVPIYKGERVVYKQSTYQTVYDKCIQSSDYNTDTDLIKLCHQQSMEASRPAPAVKIVYKPTPYLELFQKCNDYNLDQLFDKDPAAGAEARTKRIAVCKEMALQGSTLH